MSGLRLLLTASLLGSSFAATAHSPYLLPNFFDASGRDHVSVQASFTERFFVTDVAMRATDYHVRGPDGARQALTPLYTKDVAVLDVDTPRDGTYRISTGLRAGATRKAVLQDGEWKLFEAGKAPAGAVDLQSWTRADVYVSRGRPDEGALRPEGKALELEPLTHPNRLQTGGTLLLRLLFDGGPLAAQPVTVASAVDATGDSAALVELRSAADGHIEVPLRAPGLYHLMTRYRVAADGAARSYTVALTFEVTD